MASNKKARSVGFSILGVIACCLSVSLSSQVYWSVASRKWPSVAAQITSSYVSSQRSLNGSAWIPDVEYRYRVAGQEHRSTRIRFLMGVFDSLDAAAAVSKSYPVGRIIMAAYDPNSPERSVLERGMPSDLWRRISMVGLLWLTIGLLYYHVSHSTRWVDDVT